MRAFTDKMRRLRNSVCSAITAMRRLVRQLQREGRSQMEVASFKSDRVVVTVKADGHRHKVFQIFFGKDGSLYASFPYFAHTKGILAEVTVSGAPGSSCHVNLAEKGKGKVASHLVKYSHHPDGRVHFSQDGKVKTQIKRQSVPLRDQQGHIFTVLFQGLRAFESVNAAKENKTSLKLTTLTFDVTDPFPQAFRIVGRWCWLEDLQVEPARPSKIGPIVQVMDGDTLRNAFILANPNDQRHVLLLTCTPQEAVSSSHDVMMFYGGFDSPAVILRSKKPTRFLAFLYPADDFEKLKMQIGSIDYTPSSATLRQSVTSK